MQLTRAKCTESVTESMPVQWLTALLYTCCRCQLMHAAKNTFGIAVPRTYTTCCGCVAASTLQLPWYAVQLLKALLHVHSHCLLAHLQLAQPCLLLHQTCDAAWLGCLQNQRGKQPSYSAALK